MKFPRFRKPEHWSPRVIRGRCGAFCRSRGGTGCRAWPVRGEKRCVVHGGIKGKLSPEGRRAISEASKREWRKWRQQVGLNPDWRYGSTWLSRRKRETAAAYIERHGPWKPEETR
jgi:hypothetical protein